MKLADVPQGMINWSRVPRSVQPGDSGTAAGRACAVGDIQLRVVEYSAGYVADHWCHKGHILFVMSGALVIEHQDGQRYDLTPGTTWHVADESGPAHRVVCEQGATVFIVE